MGLREEQVGSQPPFPLVSLLIIPTTLEVFHLMSVSFDDSSFLNSGPERLVPTLPQLPCHIIIFFPIRRSDECTVGLDGPVEVVFGNVPTVLVVVLYELNQLPES